MRSWHTAWEVYTLNENLHTAWEVCTPHEKIAPCMRSLHTAWECSACINSDPSSPSKLWRNWEAHDKRRALIFQPVRLIKIRSLLAKLGCSFSHPLLSAAEKATQEGSVTTCTQACWTTHSLDLVDLLDLFLQNKALPTNCLQKPRSIPEPQEDVQSRLHHSLPPFAAVNHSGSGTVWHPSWKYSDEKGHGAA